MALTCLLLALLTAPLTWWDLQDGYVSTQLLFLPVLGGVLAVAFLLFPGGPATVAQALAPAEDFLPRWRAQLPPAHVRAWAAALFLSFYLNSGLRTWLQGEDFLRLENQLYTLIAMAVVFLVLRRTVRRPS